MSSFDDVITSVLSNEGGYVNDPDIIEKSINTALEKYAREASSSFMVPSNSRKYKCSESECERPAYASGLCNAHYIRSRKGKDMNAPLRARKRDDRCSECNELTNSKGGYGLCGKHYKNIRYKIIKDTLIEIMGGKCAKCGGIFHRSIYDFHHTSNKTDSPSNLISNKSISEISEEMANTVLLCANCHRLEHCDNL